MTEHIKAVTHSCKNLAQPRFKYTDESNQYHESLSQLLHLISNICKRNLSKITSLFKMMNQIKKISENVNFVNHYNHLCKFLYRKETKPNTIWLYRGFITSQLLIDIKSQMLTKSSQNAKISRNPFFCLSQSEQRQYFAKCRNNITSIYSSLYIKTYKIL